MAQHPANISEFDRHVDIYCVMQLCNSKYFDRNRTLMTCSQENHKVFIFLKLKDSFDTAWITLESVTTETTNKVRVVCYYIVWKITSLWHRRCGPEHIELDSLCSINPSIMFPSHLERIWITVDRSIVSDNCTAWQIMSPSWTEPYGLRFSCPMLHRKQGICVENIRPDCRLPRP